MKEPTVSVAMATYNGERFLQEQLDSLARQTLLPYELVACDDGSTDGTLDILRRFGGSAPFPVRFYRNPERLGYGFNFLGALGRCTGDLVAFCDQDDIWQERKLRVCAEAMSEPTVAMVSHSALVFSEQPLPRRVRHPDHPLSVIRRCRELPVHSSIPGFSIVLRREVLAKVPPPPYSATVRGAVHDLWATVAAFSCGDVALLPDELVHYRLHGDNDSLRRPVVGVKRVAPNPRGLEHAAEVKRDVSGFLRYAASFYDESARRVFYEHIQQLERTGRVYSDRAKLHRTCGRRLAAFGVLGRMIASGDYGSRALGVKAFARDAFLAAFWTNPASSEASGERPQQLPGPLEGGSR
jgi:glycosyltransferase involved in cell wall biosynthesis